MSDWFQSISDSESAAKVPPQNTWHVWYWCIKSCQTDITDSLTSVKLKLFSDSVMNAMSIHFQSVGLTTMDPANCWLTLWTDLYVIANFTWARRWKVKVTLEMMQGRHFLLQYTHKPNIYNLINNNCLAVTIQKLALTENESTGNYVLMTQLSVKLRCITDCWVAQHIISFDRCMVHRSTKKGDQHTH